MENQDLSQYRVKKIEAPDDWFKLDGTDPKVWNWLKDNFDFDELSDHAYDSDSSYDEAVDSLAESAVPIYNADFDDLESAAEYSGGIEVRDGIYFIEQINAFKQDIIANGIHSAALIAYGRDEVRDLAKYNAIVEKWNDALYRVASGSADENEKSTVMKICKDLDKPGIDVALHQISEHANNPDKVIDDLSDIAEDFPEYIKSQHSSDEPDHGMKP